MVEEKFSFLPIRYFSTGEHVGRGKAGNIGIAQAKGEYICFLDDDDFYYPDYLAAHLSVFQQNPAAKLIFSSMMAAKASVVCSSPYQLYIKELSPVIFDHINLMDMCVKCRIPISGLCSIVACILLVVECERTLRGMKTGLCGCVLWLRAAAAMLLW